MPHSAFAPHPEQSARERLILSALALFGQHGVEGTTTRHIAQQAGVNLGAIPYYFGGKEDLHVAAATHLADLVAHKQGPLHATLTAALLATQPPAALQDVVLSVLEAHAALLLDGDVPASWVQFYLRTQVTHKEAFACIFERAVEPMQKALTRALGRLMRRPEGDFTVTTMAFMLVHQYLCLRLADGVLMRRLSWDSFTPDRVRQLLTTLRPFTRAQLACAAQLDNRP